MSEHSSTIKVLFLPALAIASFLAGMDLAGISVAITNIEQTLDISLSRAQWVINIYTLFAGVFMVAGGKLADSYGAKRLCIIGLILFGGLSIVAALANDSIWLITIRALQGLAMALLWPTLVGLSYLAVEEKKRPAAVGLIIAMAGLGNAAGPIIGGALIELWSWRAILLFNVPFALFSTLVIWLYTRNETTVALKHRRVDVVGNLSLATSLFALLFAFDRASTYGFTSTSALTSFAIYVVGLIFFLLWERKSDHPMLPISYIMNLRRLALFNVNGLPCVPWFAFFLYLPKYMNQVLDYPIFYAGLGVLPMTLAMAITSLTAGRLYNRFGAKAITSLGCFCFFAAATGLWLTEVNSSYFVLLPTLILAGMGSGLTFPAASTASVKMSSDENANLASGVAFTFHVVWGSIGVAIITLIFLHVFSGAMVSELGSNFDHLSTSDLYSVLSRTDTGQSVVATLPQAAQNHVFDAAKIGFVKALHWSFLFGAICSLIAFFLAIIWMPKKETALRS